MACPLPSRWHLDKPCPQLQPSLLKTPKDFYEINWPLYTYQKRKIAERTYLHKCRFCHRNINLSQSQGGEMSKRQYYLQFHYLRQGFSSSKNKKNVDQQKRSVRWFFGNSYIAFSFLQSRHRILRSWLTIRWYLFLAN